MELAGNFNEVIHLVTNRRASTTPNRIDVIYNSSLRQYKRPKSAFSHQSMFKAGSSRSQRFLDAEFMPPQREESKALLAKIQTIKKVIH